MSIDLIITIMAGAAALAMAYTVWRGFVYKDPYEARLKAMAERRAVYKAAALGTAGVKVGPQPVKGVIRNLAKKVGKSSKQAQKDGVSLKVFLARAGIRHKDAAEYFLLAQVAFPFIFGGLAALYIMTSSRFHMSPLMSLGVCVGAAGLGYLAPKIYIKNRIAKRKKALRRALPDALDLLVVCAEAGLALNAALDRVVREMARTSSEIADELGLLLIELNFLDERRKAFGNLCDRTDLDEFRSIANTLQQAEKYGTPLAQALRVLGHDFRTERLTKAEEKAARLPAILTVPMIVFILPTLFIVIIGPAVLKTLDSLSRMS
ncbi:MAG: type II secretion system F family protein [Rhodospirillaceae bacterium]|nr:type II secretion system F family protein [Rhodospirillaceae bacterium]